MMHKIIKQLRKESGLTQIEMSEKLNVSQSTIASWENGKRRPDHDQIPAIANLFGVSVSALYGDNTATDEDTWALRERYRRDPDMRILFDAAAKATPAQLRAAAAVIKALEGGDETHDTN